MTSKGFSEKYDKWNSITNELVTQTEKEEEEEAKVGAEFLGLNGKVPRSAAEAEEKAKLEAAKNAKKALEKQKEMEESMKLVIENMNGGKDGAEQLLVLDDDCLQGRRVIVLRNCEDYKFHIKKPNDPKQSLIKVFIEGCKSCVVHMQAPTITSMVEITKCSKLNLNISKYPVNTMQIDMSNDLNVEFSDVYCFGAIDPKKNLSNDRIYHAGVTNMTLGVRVPLSDGSTRKIERKVDMIEDGAIKVAEQSVEEFQFATYVSWNKDAPELVTERVHRIGTRLFTQSELDRKMEENNEYDTELKMHEFELKVKECETHKSEGNEEFINGNYAQAVLFYSMAIDKSSILKDDNESKAFKSRHICFANRSACFLKLGHHEKALADAESCVEICPTYIKGLFRKGLALHAMGRYNEALPVLAESLKIEPKNKQIKQAIQFCEVKLEMERRKRMNI